MPIEILMPALSPTMEEGTLAKWLVKEGDKVASGDLLAEIETDKATMEFEAVDEGVIGKILIAAGTEGVKVNTAIAVLLENGESAGDIGAEKAAPQKKENAEVAASDKTAPEKGYGRGDTDATPQDDKAAPVAQKSADGNRVFASPLARRIAKDKGLDLSEVTGSGPHGRIVKADVEGATAAPKADKAAEKAPVGAPAGVTMAAGPATDAVLKTYADRPFTEVKLDGMR